MKILITGIINNKISLSKLLSEYYEINIFNLNDINNNDTKEQISIINNINKDNTSYIIEGIITKDIEFIYNLVDTIIILGIKDNTEYLNILNKYPKKVILLKNRREINKYLKAVYKNDNYIE